MRTPNGTHYRHEGVRADVIVDQIHYPDGVMSPRKNRGASFELQEPKGGAQRPRRLWP